MKALLLNDKDEANLLDCLSSAAYENVNFESFVDEIRLKLSSLADKGPERVVVVYNTKDTALDEKIKEMKPAIYEDYDNVYFSSPELLLVLSMHSASFYSTTKHEFAKQRKQQAISANMHSIRK
jgi:hypothetical protein